MTDYPSPPTPSGPTLRTPKPDDSPPNGLALAAMITGIASVLSLALGALLGPLAIWIGTKGRARPGRRRMASAGIVTGIVGTVVGSLCVVVLIIGYFAAQVLEGVLVDWDAPPIQTGEPLAPKLDPGDDDWSLYQGRTQETMCYSFEGAEGWSALPGNDSFRDCTTQYELWAYVEEAGAGRYAVVKRGHHSLVGQIIIDPVSSEEVESWFPNGDMESIRSYVLTHAYAEDDLVVAEDSDAQLGGMPAMRFVMDSDSSDTRISYAVWSPTTYDLRHNGQSGFFLVTIVSRDESVVDVATIEERLVNSFSWK